MNIYLVSYTPTNDLESVIINDRIKSIGNFYSYKSHQFFVATDLSSAEDVYKAIAKNDYIKTTMLVVSINSNVRMGYWGVEQKELWHWLEQMQNKTEK